MFGLFKRAVKIDEILRLFSIPAQEINAGIDEFIQKSNIKKPVNYIDERSAFVFFLEHFAISLSNLTDIDKDKIIQRIFTSWRMETRLSENKDDAAFLGNRYFAYRDALSHGEQGDPFFNVTTKFLEFLEVDSTNNRQLLIALCTFIMSSVPLVVKRLNETNKNWKFVD